MATYERITTGVDGVFITSEQRLTERFTNWQRIMVVLAGAGIVTVVPWFTPTPADKYTNDGPGVDLKVPFQIEEKSVNSRLVDTNYYVRVEQCATDIAAWHADQPGEVMSSLDPAVGKVGDSCYTAWMGVNESEFELLQIGMVVDLSKKNT